MEMFRFAGQAGWLGMLLLSLCVYSAGCQAATGSNIKLPPASEGPVAVLAGAEPVLVFSGLQAEPAGPQLTLLNTVTGNVVGSYSFPAGSYQGFAVANLVLQAGQTATPRVVLLGKDALYRFDAGQLHKLLPCQHIYSNIDPDNFSLLPLVFDVNADGLSDFLIPGFTEHCLAVQQADGSFANQQLQFPLSLQVQAQEFDSTQLKFDMLADIWVFDVNGDQRQDILLGSKERVGYFLQEADGRYESKPGVLQLPLVLAGSEHRVKQFKDLTRYQFYRFEDLNSDGLPDLLLLQKQYGKDMSDSRHGVRVLYGKRDGNQIFGFTEEQGFITQSGEMASLTFADFNGDKLLDACMLGGKLGVGSVMSVMMGSGVEMDILIHPQQAAGAFAIKPVVKHQTKFTFDIDNVNYGVLVKAGNFNGDSYADLLYVNRKNKLQLVLGSATGWLNGKSVQLPDTLPADPSLLTVLDLNQDGILELLIRLPQADDSFELRIASFNKN